MDHEIVAEEKINLAKTKNQPNKKQRMSRTKDHHVLSRKHNFIKNAGCYTTIRDLALEYKSEIETPRTNPTRFSSPS